MYAITVREPGGPDALEWTEVPEPQAGPGEVVIDVVASAVNRADLLQRQGFYPPPPGASDIIGLECSGRLLSLGEGVTGWNIGAGGWELRAVPLHAGADSWRSGGRRSCTHFVALVCRKGAL